ncbi:hypothetical protein GJM86_25255 [Vibrio parahaemolyticus]|nr:hypothetical protein [Vibrio parahaemolyticus]EGQ8138302.1 hypothetical protein [Vibrio parahaemolyticus]EGQ8147417.1 hypothetical protein [Vibrio parahaemolyticus]EGQ8152018.1 hypothetical protein [Vibrio parahaemolyticus]EGQ8249994.1 hypothetical protein [Vibrio parahaemolyticus]
MLFGDKKVRHPFGKYQRSPARFNRSRNAKELGINLDVNYGIQPKSLSGTSMLTGSGCPTCFQCGGAIASQYESTTRSSINPSPINQ